VTVPTAVAAVAAFLTYRAGDRDRRDQLKRQARLIAVEDVPLEEQVPPDNQHPRRPDWQPEYRYVLMRNHSQEPVFNIRIAQQSPKQPTPPTTVTVSEVASQEEASGSFRSPTPTIVHRATPSLIPVLGPGQTTFQLNVSGVPRTEEVTEYVSFTFTDNRGAQWRRLGNGQPEQIL
jgi:hypothetical protein